MSQDISVQSYENCFRVSMKQKPSQLQRKKGKKKAIKGMSSASRRNFLFKLNSLGAETEAFFVTLTVRNWTDDQKLWKKQLHSTLAGLRYHFPRISGFWRLEFQKRGAPHFHLLLFPHAGESLAKIRGILRSYWLAAIADSSVGTRRNAVSVELVRNIRKSGFYLALYSAKSVQDRSDLPTGRLWGTIGKKYLPTAQYLETPLMSEFQLIWLKRLYRRYLRANGCRHGPLIRFLRNSTLGFSGFMPRRFQRSMFSYVRGLDDVGENDQEWLSVA